MFAVLDLITTVINLYQMIIIAQVVLSWLILFGAVDRYNRVVATISDTLSRLTEPVYQPIRNFFYRIGLNLGGLDLAPLIVLILLNFLKEFLVEMLLPAATYIR